MFYAFTELEDIRDIEAYKKMLRAVKQMSPEDMRKMKNNPFFKNFTHQYNKNISESL